MKIAYLILGHTAPLQIVRMIERLRAPGNTFVVHIDARVAGEVSDPIADYAATVEDVFFAPRESCYWGTYGIVAATFGAMRMLSGCGREFDYAVLLSGQDYPIKPADEIAAFFEGLGGAELIEAFPLDAPNRWTPQGGRFQALARVLHWTFSFRSKTLHVPVRRRFPLGWRPHGGSQWWCLTRGAVEWILATLQEKPGLARYFKYTFIPDEAMIQTMVANSPFAGRVSARQVHYIDWERPNPKYPRTLDDEDFDRLAGAPELFARKMNAEASAGLMDRVDGELLG